MERTSSDMNWSSNVQARQQQVAPFVAKTYQMVSDPRSDSLIRWGKGNNSFLVLDSNGFSQFLLPSYFKHSNFSSFVRQLNTYGFKKVDPDRWEFAHDSFLRGQVHLLPCITRRKRKTDGCGSSMIASTYSSRSNSGGGSTKMEEALAGDDQLLGDELLLKEICRLRHEQRALDEELQEMNRRIRDTETKPEKVMSFLVRVVEDPELLPLMLSKKEQLAAAKRRRIGSVPSSPPRPPPPSSSPADHTTVNQPLEFGRPLLTLEEVVTPSAMNNYGARINTRQYGAAASASMISFQQEVGTLSESPPESAAPPFPFSLLGHGFL